MTNGQEALARAIDAAGGLSPLARICGVAPPTAFKWDVAPAHHCPAIEAATGVSCEELRPDLAWVRDEDERIVGHMVKAGVRA